MYLDQETERRFLVNSVRNNRGIGLITVIFVIVIMSMFGLLIARFVTIGSTISIEDYLWAQAIYSAESAAQLQILCNDVGGNLGGPDHLSTLSQVGQFSITIGDDWGGVASPSTVSVQATSTVAGQDIVRTIEIKYRL